MKKETLVNGFENVKREGIIELGEGLFLQTFASIKNENWFGTEMDNMNWDGCEDGDIFLLSDTGDAIRVDSIEELLDEVEYEPSIKRFFSVESEEVRYVSKYGKLERNFSGDSWNELAYTLEDAIGTMHYYWNYLTESEKDNHWITVTEFEGDVDDVNTWEWIKSHSFVSKVKGIEFISKSFKDDLYIASQISNCCLDKSKVSDGVYKDKDFEFEIKEYDFNEWGDIEVDGVVTIY